MEQKLWKLQQLRLNEKKSVTRLYDMDVPVPQWPDFQCPPDNRSQEHPLNLLRQCMAWC